MLPFWLLLPGLLVVAGVQIYPALFTVYLGFHSVEPSSGQYIFRGLANFQRLLRTSLFYESLGHTAVFLIGYVALTLVGAMLVALLLNQRLRLSAVAVTLIFIPWVLSDVVAGVVWRLFVVPDYGVFSPFFANPAIFGGSQGISVLTSPPPPPLVRGLALPPAPAMLWLILASTWKALPFISLLLLAALQTVPAEVLESARIDGANHWHAFRAITLPLILPTVVVALFNLLIGGINGVGMVFSMTSGGPGSATTVLSYLLYVIGFSRIDFGLAAALSLCMTVINIALVAVTIRVSSVGEEE
ncbi:MAG: sugar ABC transporter permease [Roseiflexaceae bacterium]|nr:sugar ABC transporter permease [Roseiflexaceae bacterium]